MDAFQQSHRLIGAPVAGDPPPALPQQSPYWYPSSSPPPPPGGYHHQPPPYPSPPQWNQSGDAHPFPHHLPPYPQHQQPPPVHNPYPPPLSYHSHSPGGPYSAPPLRYPPPPLHPSAYAPPNQAWGNSYWGQQGWEHPERNTPFSHEDDWAARAKAWADSKPAAEYHHTPSQFTPIGRMDEHNYAYHEQHQQVVGTPMDAQRSFPQSSNQHLSDFRNQDSSHEITSYSSGLSFRTGGHVLHNAGVEAMTSNTAHMSSPQKNYGPSIYEQEVPYIYSSRTDFISYPVPLITKCSSGYASIDQASNLRWLKHPQLG